MLMGTGGPFFLPLSFQSCLALAASALLVRFPRWYPRSWRQLPWGNGSGVLHRAGGLEVGELGVEVTEALAPALQTH